MVPGKALSGDSQGPPAGWLERAALWCAIGSAGAIAASIAVSQLLLGAALLLLIILVATRRLRLRLPSGWPLLAFFIAWTVLSWLVNGHLREGLPQIRKFYVLLIVVVIASLFRGVRDARWVALLWVVLATASGLWGIWQFWQRWHAAQLVGKDFYLEYVAARITGFNSHWMTFSQQLMLALACGLAMLLWDRDATPPRRWVLGAAGAVCGLGILLAETRGVWFATAAALIYLLWCWRRWTVVLLPVLALLAFAAGPQGLRERMLSVARPHGEKDSNMHRYVTFRTGLEMIKSHPLLGLGPEMPGREFSSYVPPDIHRPLPEGFYGHLHNIYTHFAAERGLPAMFAMIGFLVWNAVLWLRRLRGSPGEAAWVLRAGVAMLLGILATGIFEHNLGDSEILTMTMAAVAFTDCALREAQHV